MKSDAQILIWNNNDKEGLCINLLDLVYFIHLFIYFLTLFVT